MIYHLPFGTDNANRTPEKNQRSSLTLSQGVSERQIRPPHLASLYGFWWIATTVLSTSRLVNALLRVRSVRFYCVGHQMFPTI